MVDLPGYGYASRGKSQRLAFSTMIMSYMAQRQELTCLFILIDSRLEPQKIDLDFINQMGENGVPFALVFTKADKLSNAALKRSVERYCQRLSEEWEELPPLFVTSSVKGTGREELLNYIESINQSIQEQ